MKWHKLTNEADYMWDDNITAGQVGWENVWVWGPVGRDTSYELYTSGGIQVSLSDDAAEDWVFLCGEVQATIHPVDPDNKGPKFVREHTTVRFGCAPSLGASITPFTHSPAIHWGKVPTEIGIDDRVKKPIAPFSIAPKPESILAEAERIVNGERAADYGDSTANMERIGKITELCLSQAEWAKLDSRSIPATVVAKILMAVKLGREAHTHKRDNLVDLCGYAEILNRAQEAKC